jgi:hypothetical protein
MRQRLLWVLPLLVFLIVLATTPVSADIPPPPPPPVPGGGGGGGYPLDPEKWSAILCHFPFTGELVNGEKHYQSYLWAPSTPFWSHEKVLSQEVDQAATYYNLSFRATIRLHIQADTAIKSGSIPYFLEIIPVYYNGDIQEYYMKPAYLEFSKTVSLYRLVAGGWVKVLEFNQIKNGRPFLE